MMIGLETVLETLLGDPELCFSVRYIFLSTDPD